jgi:hypothetical protein
MFVRPSKRSILYLAGLELVSPPYKRIEVVVTPEPIPRERGGDSDKL